MFAQIQKTQLQDQLLLQGKELGMLGGCYKGVGAGASLAKSNSRRVLTAMAWGRCAIASVVLMLSRETAPLTPHTK